MTTHPHGFDPYQAARMAFLALVAMCDSDSELKRWAGENGFDEAYRFKCGHNRSVVLRKGGELTVVFAGTEPRNSQQWVDHNFNARATLSPFRLLTTTPEPTRDKEDMVHLGFLQALHSCNEGEQGDLWERTLHCIGEIKAAHPIHKITFSGHSLGGAMTVMALADIAAKKEQGVPCPLAPEEVSEAYLLGAPRTGDEIFTQRFNAYYGNRVYNGIYGNDPVPRVPLQDANVLKGFAVTGMRAVGKVHHLSENGQISDTIPLLRAPQSFHHLPQRYEEAYLVAAGVRSAYPHTDWIDKLQNYWETSWAHYAEMGSAKDTLTRRMP